MEIENSIVWANGTQGGTPLTAENLNKVNRDTKAAIESLDQDATNKIAAIQVNIDSANKEISDTSKKAQEIDARATEALTSATDSQNKLGGYSLRVANESSVVFDNKTILFIIEGE